MTGRVVSMAVAPPEAIPARFPKYFTRRGVARSVATSLKILSMREGRMNYLFIA